MFDTVLGLPIHPLIVHATVVVVPVAAIAVALSVLWGRFRNWAAWGPLALATASLVLDPLTTQSGEALERMLPRTALLEKHTHLADGLLPWLIALVVGAAALYYHQRFGTRRPLPRWAVIASGVVAVAAAIGTLVEVVLIGHSGAAAAWTSVG